MAAVERFTPERRTIDPLAIVKDYATVPRLEYRYVDGKFGCRLGIMRHGESSACFESPFRPALSTKKDRLAGRDSTVSR
jgi:hypothetical protein